MYSGGDERLRKPLAYESVYDGIRARIRDGVWSVGDRLPTIEELSRDFGTGVSSVREAVKILGKQGVLSIEQGRGTFVAAALSDAPSARLLALEHATLLQLTEARLVIEPELAARAAAGADAERKRAILANALAMWEKIARGEPFLKEDMGFHRLIAEAAGNLVLAEMMRRISDLLLDSRRRSMQWDGQDEKAASYHLLIAHAIFEGRAEEAREQMRRHVEDIAHHYRTCKEENR